LYAKTVERILFSEVKNRTFSRKRGIANRRAAKTVELQEKIALARQATDHHQEKALAAEIRIEKCFRPRVHPVGRIRRYPLNPEETSPSIAVTVSPNNDNSRTIVYLGTSSE
jgi:hypothetical protein